MKKVTDTDAVVVDYDKGREYANKISEEIRDIKEKILFVEYVPASISDIAPRTTPFVADLDDCVDDLRQVMDYLYANNCKKDDLLRQIINTIQLIFDCKEEVYKFPEIDFDF